MPAYELFLPANSTPRESKGDLASQAITFTLRPLQTVSNALHLAKWLGSKQTLLDELKISSGQCRFSDRSYDTLSSQYSEVL